MRHRQIFGNPSPLHVTVQEKWYYMIMCRLLFMCFLIFPIYVQAQNYEDMNIRTWAQTLGGAPLPQFEWIPASSVPPSLGADKIVGIETFIYSNSPTEVFNITRLSGLNNRLQQPSPFGNQDQSPYRKRSGGYSEFFRVNPGLGFGQGGLLQIEFPCTRDGGVCSGNLVIDNFFKITNFPYFPSRTFATNTNKRGVFKVNYVCSGSCAAPTVNDLWIKLGGWNMYAKAAKTIDIENLYGISPLNIVGMAATIRSDETDGMWVDNLEHLGQKVGEQYGVNPAQRGRGGIMWYGMGCGIGTNMGAECREGSTASELAVTQPRLRLYGGAGGNVDPTPWGYRKSSYRDAPYSFAAGQPLTPKAYKNPGINRGWAKIEHIGSPSPVALPYAMKTKAIPLGQWNMSTMPQRTIPLSTAGISPDRVSGISTTIRSDATNCGPGCFPGSSFTNLHRPPYNSGTNLGNDHWAMSGGLTYVDGNNIRLSLLKTNNANNQWVGYYDNHHSLEQLNGQPYNRGYVRLDYLAGSCEQGPAGFKITAVPGTMVGTCTGTSLPFTIEGAGRGTLSGTTTDSLTYVYKQITSNGTNRTVTVRVVSQDAANTNDYGLAGVMFRADLATNSRNASMVATRSNAGGVYFRRRLSTNGTTQVSQNTGTDIYNRPIKSPCWVRIQKAGSTIRAYYNTSTSTTMPTTQWIKLGPDQTIDMGTSYYVGLMVSNLTDPRLSKVQFSGLTETIP